MLGSKALGSFWKQNRQDVFLLVVSGKPLESTTSDFEGFEGGIGGIGGGELVVVAVGVGDNVRAEVEEVTCLFKSDGKH